MFMCLEVWASELCNEGSQSPIAEFPSESFLGPLPSVFPPGLLSFYNADYIKLKTSISYSGTLDVAVFLSVWLSIRVFQQGRWCFKVFQKSDDAVSKLRQGQCGCSLITLPSCLSLALFHMLILFNSVRYVTTVDGSDIYNIKYIFAQACT